ncbi:uncharacterized protein TrAFT101_002757 [Trichoderma asperellum]|uniref:Uncharacterized protein n=1 Tax=Trichoderma asperellum (strain ATCC 204424 / CBS 433.97 / NBRC 101777) TaxID=1042311 RepID=A0A2T3ZHA6_TRIA4|nr:hypothetical protein M441DRAFT_34777 [Trichoderma asperellum CBS 433.97]PTB44194.1 hypothetical protein M441DRAFT_34777 [Trichoderma asperellum CBS 433.97]UKZ86938.1 hypothetical protein TrAFT101_002757 [Trichoderma asperellum]
MDFVKNAMHKNEGQPAAQGAAAPQAQGAQKEDYVDKAFGMGTKKAGYNMDRNTQEKITDAGREMYEKVTGSKVNPKISN